MYLRSASLRLLRNHRKLDIELGPGLNLFFGGNASGKTNLLEALYYLCGLRSFRGAKPADIIAWGEEACTISGLAEAGLSGHELNAGTGSENGAGLTNGVGLTNGAGVTGGADVTGGASVTSGTGLTDQADSASGAAAPPAVRTDKTRVTRLSVSISAAGRRIAINGRRPENVSEYLLSVKAAGFSSEDLFLVGEYPSHRRRFIDRAVFHLEPAYITLANRYRQAVSQLNAALKAGDEKTVTTFEEIMAPLAGCIVSKRTAYLDALTPLAAAVFDRILGGGTLGVSYRTQLAGGDEDALTRSCLDRMAAKRPEGMRRGHTGVGPHTDDLGLSIDGRDLRSGASRGQARLAYLALVLADAGLYYKRRGIRPVLLLDDAMSELDERRSDALLEYLSGIGQAVLTSTDDGLVRGRKARLFRVEGGIVRPV